MAPYLAALRKAWCSQTLPRLRHRLAHHLSTAPHPFPAALVVPESAKVGHAALKIRKLPLETSASSRSPEGLASPRTTPWPVRRTRRTSYSPRAGGSTTRRASRTAPAGQVPCNRLPPTSRCLVTKTCTRGLTACWPQTPWHLEHPRCSKPAHPNLGAPGCRRRAANLPSCSCSSHGRR